MNVEFAGGYFTHGGSSAVSVYNKDQKAVIKAFGAMEKDALYLFFVENAKGRDGSSDYAGYMPLGYQSGFIYGNPGSIIVAHEVAHGAFNLYHTFSGEDFVASQNTTDNLMDYKGGKEIWKEQWKLIHNPRNLIFKFLQEEEEALMVNNQQFKGYWKKLDKIEHYQQYTSLKYDMRFIPDDNYHATQSFFVRLTNGMYFMATSGGTAEPEMKYAISLDQKNWIYFDIKQIPVNCLSCELDEIGKQITIKSIDASLKIGVPVLNIIGGVVALATIARTGGQSLSVWRSAQIGLTSLSAAWAIAGGTINLMLGFSEDSEFARRIPTDFISGTVGLVCLCVIDDKITQVRVEGALALVNGILTFNIKDPTSLNIISSTISIISMTVETGEIIETIE